MLRKKAVRGANFKDNEDIEIVLAWEDMSLDAVVRKDKLSAK